MARKKNIAAGQNAVIYARYSSHNQREVSIEQVALLAEGVDRNQHARLLEQLLERSPSSRRAWIEISRPSPHSRRRTSPSSRRAWIEISKSTAKPEKSKSRPPRGGRG